jgi:hypothetical protein
MLAHFELFRFTLFFRVFQFFISFGNFLADFVNTKKINIKVFFTLIMYVK